MNYYKLSIRAFTLIELLIVIAIIGILMALLFPAVNGAMDAARRAQAQNDVTQIAMAVNSYASEYGKLPTTQSGNQVVEGELLETLMGGITNNPRKITFIEISEWKKGKSGLVTAKSKVSWPDYKLTEGSYSDPWGGPYRIAMDISYENKVTAGVATKTEIVRKSVAVWSDPKTQAMSKNASDRQQDRRYVTSW